MMNKNNLHKGVIVPVVTPLNDDFSVDVGSLERIIRLITASGTSPFIAGTTGEASSLSVGQKETLVAETVRQVNGTTPVYAGISGNCLPETLELAKRFADLGADVLVASMPSYYPLNETYAMHYCEQLAEASPRPLIFYNIPATAGYSIPLALLDKLSYHPLIAGLKDSERDRDRLDQALKLWKNREDFVHLTGWAAMSVYALQNGSDGIVPSTGNFAPQQYADLYRSAMEGNWEMAFALQKKTDEWSALYQSGRNLSESLAALKVLMSVKGLCGTQMMPPICRMEPQEEERYRKELKKMLLNGEAS
jgi:4-hydroxy-tetrahydrodipicolinate synthase